MATPTSIGIGTATRAALTHGTRIDFLDAARGLAAIAVLMSHLLDANVPESHPFTRQILYPGLVGVCIFFIVSGFVIPLTLERGGHVGRFWINRLFRIYPLYLAALMIGLVLGLIGIAPYQQVIVDHLAHTLLIHLPIMQNPLPVGNLVHGSWTLQVEFVFYAAFSLAFALGWHRRALLLTMIASAGLAVLSIAAMATHHHLPLGRPGFLVATLAGFLFYRHFRGDLSTQHLIIGVCAECAAVGLAFAQEYGPDAQAEFALLECVLSWLAAHVLFVSLYLTRRAIARHPGPAQFVGRISYSLYLTHPFIVAVTLAAWGASGWNLLAVPMLAGLAALALYHAVERPGIAWGHRLSDRLLARNQHVHAVAVAELVEEKTTDLAVGKSP